MNLMILKRFRNELIISVAVIFALSAFFYKLSSKQFVESKKDEIVSSIDEINRVNELKKLWKNRAISKKANMFKNIVPKEKIKLFKKSSTKIVVSYQNLNIKELNRVIKNIMNNPFVIVKLKIDEPTKESYTMELTCKW
jgi:ABC-type histidine transport system ATPase subunit